MRVSTHVLRRRWTAPTVEVAARSERCGAETASQALHLTVAFWSWMLRMAGASSECALRSMARPMALASLPSKLTAWVVRFLLESAMRFFSSGSSSPVCVHG